MNIFLCGLFVVITRNVVYTAPAPTKNQFINSIIDKCPGDVEYVFKELKSFNCSIWDNLKINETKLTSENEKHYRCLLFQDSFLSFCKELTNLNITFPKLEVETIHRYTTEQVCKDLFPTNRTLEHELSKIIIPQKCEKFCTDYDTDEPVVGCSMAYFFAHINISSLTSPLNQKNVVQPISTQILSPPNPSLNHLEVAPQNHLDTSVNKPESKNISHNLSISELKSTTIKLIQKPLDHPKNNSKNEQRTDSQITESNAANNHSSSPDRSPLEQNSAGPILDQVNSNREKPSDPETTQKETPAINKGESPNNEQTYITVNDKTPDTAQPALVHGTEALSNNSEVEVDAKLDENNVEKEEDSAVKPVLNDNGIDQQEDDVLDEDQDRGPQQQMDEDQDRGPQQQMDEDQDSGPQQQMDDAQEPQKVPVEDQKPKGSKISNTLESAANEENVEELDGDSYFFSYFMVICVLFVLGYVGYHNRIKVMALVLEGKRNKRQYRGRRPNSANYHKLDSNLEEAISSTCTKNANNVIY